MQDKITTNRNKMMGFMKQWKLTSNFITANLLLEMSWYRFAYHFVSFQVSRLGSVHVWDRVCRFG